MTRLNPPPSPEEEQVLGEVLTALRSLQHGHVQLIVQDRRVVQIETLAKRRRPGTSRTV